MEWMVWLGVFVFLGTTAWMLYKFNVMRKVRKGLREQAIVEEVALIVRIRNAAVIVFLYSMSCVCFLQYSLTDMPQTHEQYYARLHSVEFLIGICVGAAVIAIGSLLLQDAVITQLKQRVRQRSWRLKFLRGRQKARRDSLVKHD